MISGITCWISGACAGTHDQLEDAVALLAGREADRLGHAHLGVALRRRSPASASPRSTGRSRSGGTRRGRSAASGRRSAWPARRAGARRRAASGLWPRFFGLRRGRVPSCPRPCHSGRMEDRVSPALLDWYARPCARAAVARAAGHGGAARSLPRLAVRGDAAADHHRACGALLREVHRALWPTVEALAAADEAAVMAEWAGLGYYSRARNLVACARAVARRGGFPYSEEELRELPGHRRVHRGGDRGDRPWPARGGDRCQCRARGRAPVRDRRAAARRAQGDPRGGRDDHSADSAPATSPRR